jgi:hypothetical protein
MDGTIKKMLEVIKGEKIVLSIIRGDANEVYLMLIWDMF